MEQSNKILLVAVLVVSLLVLGIFLQPRLEEELAPTPLRAWVAIEVEGEPIEVGRRELSMNQSFHVHAVLEAETSQGSVYYTQAPNLWIDGQEIPAEQIRPWDRPRDLRIRWFVVEGTPPFLELDEASQLSRFELRELYRPDWPAAWRIPGRFEPTHNPFGTHINPSKTFGIQRYQLKLELYPVVENLLPEARFVSAGAAEVRTLGDAYPTVRRTLPGRLEVVSSVFGLPQIEVAADAPELHQGVTALVEEELAFRRPNLLRDHLDAAGTTWDALSWRSVDLRGEIAWTELKPGDLLRVGDRMVILYEDRGDPGVLDYGDLCFDFVTGAAVRALEEVFAGEGEAVELAVLDEALTSDL